MVIPEGDRHQRIDPTARVQGRGIFAPAKWGIQGLIRLVRLVVETNIERNCGLPLTVGSE